MSVAYLQLIILSVIDDVPVGSETFLMTNFVNLKIKSTQSFRGAHSDRVCVRVFIGVGTYMCMSTYVCPAFLIEKSYIGDSCSIVAEKKMK
jgi:hypothetical protein